MRQVPGSSSRDQDEKPRHPAGALALNPQLLTGGGGETDEVVQKNASRMLRTKVFQE